jgi:hypothetical protein
LQPGRVKPRTIDRLRVLAASDDPAISAAALGELARAAFYGQLGTPGTLSADERRVLRDAWRLLGLIPGRLH